MNNLTEEEAKKLGHFEVQLQRLQDEFAQTGKKLLDAREKFRNLESENHRLQEIFDSLSEENSALEAIKIALINDIDSAKSNIKTLQEKIGESDLLLKSHREEMNSKSFEHEHKAKELADRELLLEKNAEEHTVKINELNDKLHKLSENQSNIELIKENIKKVIDSINSIQWK